MNKCVLMCTFVLISPQFFSALLSSLDLEEMENISPFRKRCIIPVLGLIENSLYENSLVHNILCMLLQLLNACPKLADILLDHGLLYVLFNTLSTLNGMENGYGCQNKRMIHSFKHLHGFMGFCLEPLSRELNH